MRDLYNLLIGFRAAIYRLYRYSTPVGALHIFFHPHGKTQIYSYTMEIMPLSSPASSRVTKLGGIESPPLSIVAEMS